MYCVQAMTRQRIQKQRQKWTRRPAEQTFDDSRTKRARTRADQLREELEEEVEAIEEALRERYQ